MDKTLIHTTKPLEEVIGGFKGEQGTVLQLAGNKPEEMYKATKLSLEYGYRKVNLNCGCPSDRAVDHHGVCLMKDPPLVRSLCAAMVDASSSYKGVELSLKCRNGVDSFESYDYLRSFIQTVSSAGISHFIIHARKAILGLKSRKNLQVPEINYQYTYQLVKEFPALQFTLNGAITSLLDIQTHLKHGVRSLS